MKDVNKIILVGRLGADPVLRDTKNGLSVAQFPLATSRWVKETGQETAQTESQEAADKTQWHRVIAWGKQADACAQFLKKGDSVYVEGSVRTHKYESKEGDSRMAFEVHAETVSFLGKFGNGRKQEDSGMKAQAVGE